MPLRLRTDQPFLQVQPIPQAAYAEAVLGGAGLVGDLEAFGERDWDDYHAAIVEPARDAGRQPGRYAAEARRRVGAPPAAGGGCPFAAASAAAG